MKQASTRQLANAAIAKIRTQIKPHPDAELMFGIITQAIIDLHNPQLHSQSKGDKYKRNKQAQIIETARDYLSGPMPHAHLLGLDPDWIRRALKTAGIYTIRS